MTQGPPADLKLQRSSRDPATVPPLLEAWLAGALPDGADPKVTLHSGIDSNGMSSETLVFDADLDRGRRAAARASTSPASRRPPRTSRCSWTTRCRTSTTPCGSSGSGPACRCPTSACSSRPARSWARRSSSWTGSTASCRPTCRRTTGATTGSPTPRPEDQRRLQDNTVKAIADLHAIPDADRRPSASSTATTTPGETPLARNLAWARAWYEWAVPDLGRSPMVERALAWLEANEPDSATDTVLCWGDSRIGNVMFQDFAPVGVLDWEMATIGPREMDLSWMVFAHQVFESITEVFGMPGHAGLHARGGRQGDVRRGHRQGAGRPHLVPPLQRRPVVRGLHAHRRPARSTSARSRSPTTSSPCSTTSR